MTLTAYFFYKVHVDHYLWVTRLEHEIGADMPTSRRHHARGAARLKWEVGAPPSLSEDVVVKLLRTGTADMLREARAVAARESPHAHLYPIPSLEELEREVLFSVSMRRNVSASDLDVAAVDGPPIAADKQDAGADDDGADSDDDVDDERASKGRTRNNNHDDPLVPGRSCDLRDRSVAAIHSAGVARDDNNNNGGDDSVGDAVEKDRADDDDAGTAPDDSKNDHDDGRGNVKDDGNDDAAGVARDDNNNDDDDDDDDDDDRAEGDEDGDDSG